MGVDKSSGLLDEQRSKPGRQSVIPNKSDREQAKGNPGSRRPVRAEIRQKS